MTTNAKKTALNLEEVNTQNTNNSAESAKQTRRVWETQAMWDVVFDHVVTLATLALKGEALPEKPQKGFAFGKVVDKHDDPVKGKLHEIQPHIKGYALGVIAGFGTFSAKKFAKAFSPDNAKALFGDLESHSAALAAVETYGLANVANRRAIAEQLAAACGFCALSKAEEAISKADAKQGRAICLAIAKQLAGIGTQTEAEDVQPKAEEPKAKKTSPKGKKSSKKAAKTEAA